jgi:hypothetical protein
MMLVSSIVVVVVVILLVYGFAKMPCFFVHMSVLCAGISSASTFFTINGLKMNDVHYASTSIQKPFVIPFLSVVYMSTRVNYNQPKMFRRFLISETINSSAQFSFS